MLRFMIQINNIKTHLNQNYSLLLNWEIAT